MGVYQSGVIVGSKDSKVIAIPNRDEARRFSEPWII